MKCVIKILISTSSVSWGEAKDHTGRTAWKTLATTLFLQHTTKVTCYITATPLNSSLFVPSVTDYPSLFGPDNGYRSYTEGNNTLNSSCQHTCFFGFLTIDSLPCRVTGAWNGTMLACESNVVGGVMKKSPRVVWIFNTILYRLTQGWHHCERGSDLMCCFLFISAYKLSVLAPFGGGALSTVCCVAFCCMKHRKSECFSISLHRPCCAAVTMICYFFSQEQGQCWNIMEHSSTHAPALVK